MLAVAVLLLVAWPAAAYAAEESVCARVKIEIRQELTFERQAFDAHMRINNGLDNITLQDVEIAVEFTDEDGQPVLASSDPDNTEAAFFIRIDTLSGIDDISGSGTVQPASSADIHWLIIPAPGAGGQLSAGKLYFVGATLRYSLGGEAQVTEVTPDYIFVKPMPLLALDYFLPGEVYADDAFTAEIEPPEPFTLGVRVKNNGYGTARRLKIDSAQPKIVENEQGLLIGFQILGSTVQDQPATASLLVDLGDIAPAAAATGRWLMQTTLSGEFVAFDAALAHADELGGELTSLLEGANTHPLIHDVLVDLPGRDRVHDFLAEDDDRLRVYESSGLDTDVTDQSTSSMLQPTDQSGAQVRYIINAPATAGFFYLKLPDPHGGAKRITQVLRSDGKQVSSPNVWLSRTRRQGSIWDHYINLFDANTTGQYQLAMQSDAAADRDDDGVPDEEDAFPDDADESADSDNDGVGDNADCDDTDDTVYPGATELCDRKDNDCDPTTPERDCSPCVLP